MSELWIPITVVAAFSQNVRSALQKNLTAHLSAAGATQVRFLYALPFAILYIAVLCYFFGYSIPTPSKKFILYAMAGGMAQIFATVFLVKLFSYRNFFVGTTYSKTEAIQTAVLGFFILSDPLTFGSIIGIAIGLIGVVVISATKNKFNTNDMASALGSKSAAIGISSGLLFAVASVGYRGASLSLEGGYIIRAAFTLVCVLMFQSLLVSFYILRKEPGQTTSVIQSWRISWLVGLAGMLASVCWFTAMTIENAAHVRALGQVELVFAFLASVIIFKEKIRKLEFAGVSLILAGVVVLLLYK